MNIHTGGPQLAQKCVQNFLRAIRNLTVRIYIIVQAENHAIARSRTNFTIKSNTWDQKVNLAIVKPYCLYPYNLRTPVH